jgi:hypothetical protein
MAMEELKRRTSIFLSEIQNLTHKNDDAILNALERFVANRQATYETFKRLDPASRQTRDALSLLEKARDELAKFTRSSAEKPKCEISAE